MSGRPRPRAPGPSGVVRADDATPTTYLGEGIDEPAVAAFFHAAAVVHRAAPWRVIPADGALAFSIDELGIDDMVVTTVGQHGQGSGFLIFADVASWRAFAGAGGEPADVPAEPPAPHLEVHIGPRREVAGTLVAEVVEHRWELADEDAIPRPVTIDEDLAPRPMTADELLVCEAVALALAAMATTTTELARAWSGGAPVTRTFRVATHVASLAVTLTAPAEAAAHGGDVALEGIVAALGWLEETDEELDAEAVDELSRRLVAELRASPEGRSIPGAGTWAELLMTLGVRCFDATIASLGPEEVSEIVGEIVQREVAEAGGEAAPIVAELRAFYTFLDRVHGLEQAAACLEVLGRELDVDRSTRG